MSEAFRELWTGSTMWLMLAGVVAGIVIGALPGLTATMGVALLVPFTFWLPTLPALMVLLGVYVGAMYGGALPAVLIRTPGTPAAAATTLDGYPMAQAGKAGLAIGISCITGVVGGVFSTLVLMFAAPQVARFALQFGPAEYFALAVFGLSVIASLSERSLLKGALMGACGVLLATIGLDPITAVPRFTFGLPALLEGLALVPVLVGVFALGEVFYQSSLPEPDKSLFRHLGRVLPSRSDLRRITLPTLLASVTGTLIGALPGVGGDVAAFVAYDQAKKVSRRPEEFGKGSVEGLAAAECANNSVTGGAMIPMLTLGVPGDAVTAVILGSLLMHGVRPGPDLFEKQTPLLAAIFLGLLVANLLVLPVGLAGAKLFAQTVRAPRHYLFPIVVVLCVVGSYALNNSLLDVGVMFLFGVVGWALRRADFPVAPLVLGLILGRMTEENFRRALILSGGSWSIFLERPLSATLLLLAALSVALSLRQRYHRRKVSAGGSA
ncbi:MAG: tripartite tricarboxylate transporter permease [Armatimonadetes bacterium]|nr:tripartite tricarboxylate transporter permease [Armatimonadota bacterium]